MHLIHPALLLLTLLALDPHAHYPVTFALDGDTLQIGGVGRVRLLGIDAPELARGFDTAAPFAREAQTHLAALVTGRYVRLEADIEPADRYGRLLAYVILDDGVLVNAEMLRAGLARVTARQPLRRLDELRRAEREAQSARRGIWGDQPAPNTPAGTAPRPSRPTRRSRARPG